MAQKWKEYFISIWFRKFWILFVTLCFFVGLLIYSGKTADQFAYGQISLNYEGAAEGLNPNGTRYSIHELANEALLEQVLEDLGLTGVLETNDFFDALIMYPVNSQSVDKRYIASGYSIELELKKELPYGITASAVLERLLMRYHENFIDLFALDDSALDIDWAATKRLEYFEFGSLLQSHVKNLIHYLDNLIDESGMSQYKIEGESFRSLLHSLNVFEEIYLDKYIAFVQEKNLFRDVDEYYNKLVYQRLLLEQRYKQAKAEYEIRRDVVNMYDKHMVAFVMVPMYDSRKGLYMSRTKIGIDTYTVAANTYSVSSGSLAKSIDEIDANIDHTRLAVPNTADSQKADEMIETIISQMDKLVQRIREAIQRYENYRSKTDVRYFVRQPSITQVFKVKRNLLLSAGFAVALSIMFILWDQYRGERKV